MAQVSYGTITITDTTDLTTYIRYATKAPLTAASQFQETPTTNTRYIAVLSIPASDPIPAWNSSSWKWLEFIGTDGVSVLGTREIYYLKTNSTTVAAPANGSDISQASANVENQWTKSVPTYVTNGEYWTCIQTHLDGSPTWVYGSPVLNQSLTDMNHDIDVMKSITQQSVEDSQGALSIATGINQHFFSVPNDYSTSVPAGSYITEINVDEFKQSPSGGNLLTRSDGIWLRNGADILASLQGTGLTFLIPTGTYKGRKSLEILGGTTPALKLYDAQNNNAVATLNSNGLVLSKGGIRVNTVGSNNGVYISSENLGSKVTSLDADKTNWRAVIGSKFGVDSEGNLYANEAHISGEITASKLTINSNATINDTSGLIRNDAIDVGGRNLIRNYNDFSKWNKEGSAKVTKQSDGYFKIESTNSNNSRYGIYQRELPIEKNTDYTLSVDVVEGYCNVGIGLTNWPGNATFTAENGRNVYHFNSGTTTSDQYTWSVYINGTYDGTTSKHTLIKQIKLEKGNKATDWTPAPEDVQSEIDAKKSIHTLDSSYSKTYAQLLTWSKENYDAGQWAVSSTAGVAVGDTVRIKCSVSDMNNAAVYVLGTVTEVQSATILKMKSHGLDTTVIDGGNILTNSITANQIKGNTLTLGQIDTNVQNSILNENIEVGGRNLLYNSANCGNKRRYKMHEYRFFRSKDRYSTGFTCKSLYCW